MIAFAACLVNPRFNRLPRLPGAPLAVPLASGQERDASAFLPLFHPFSLPCRGPQILLHYFGKGYEQIQPEARQLPNLG